MRTHHNKAMLPYVKATQTPNRIELDPLETSAEIVVVSQAGLHAGLFDGRTVCGWVMSAEFRGETWGSRVQA
jgi:hypothetical protein